MQVCHQRSVELPSIHHEPHRLRACADNELARSIRIPDWWGISSYPSFRRRPVRANRHSARRMKLNLSSCGPRDCHKFATRLSGSPMRLKVENALASSDDRRKAKVLAAILHQVSRLDRPLHDLLAMTQAGEPKLANVELSAFLTITIENQRELAAADGLSL
jgi:hypothetical protein